MPADRLTHARIHIRLHFGKVLMMTPWKQLLLSVYYYGTLPHRQWRNRRAMGEGNLPVVVVFYHRVADAQLNDWTLTNRQFARQIDWLQSRFELISLGEAQRRIREKANRRPCISISFDDGYSDNCHLAIPLLVKREIPFTYFVAAKQVLQQEPFEHDLASGDPPRPNTIEQLRAMAAAGGEVGVHSYSHADLGQITDRQQLHREVITARDELQAALDRPLRYFAFPFGYPANLNRDAFHLAGQCGYEAVCSAYGGYNIPGDDPFHIQRIGLDGDMIGMKNSVSIDPRKLRVPRFDYQVETLDEKTRPSRSTPRNIASVAMETTIRTQPIMPRNGQASP